MLPGQASQRTMPPDPEKDLPDGEELDEQQLCISCTFPNDPEAHFCVKCGAPLTAYSATAPLERILAEGYIYRQASERPRKLVVVLGVWMIFGVLGMQGFLIAWVGRELGFVWILAGVLLMAISVVMIAKTTRNYLSQRDAEVQAEA